MINVKHAPLYALAALAFLASCDDKDNTTVPHATGGSTTTTTTTDSTTTISSTTIEANRFVYEVMSTYYYWNTELPSNDTLDYRKQSDTEEYFYTLLSSKDRFSFIIDDSEEYEQEEQGNYTALGWEFTLSYISSSSDNIVAIINQVYDDTPASRAGAKRGDIIYTVNGTQLTKDNYSSLLYTGTTFSFAGYHCDEKISYSMTKEAITVNPVACTNIFDLEDGRRCGYLLFNEYKAAFDDDLLAALSNFKSEGISEMILDLRYNNGGYVSTEMKLNSALAPEEVVTAHKPMMYYDFNKTLQRAYPDAYSHDASTEYFTDTIGVNLDLDRVIILCSGNTYSAAEATIWCLKPYMDVVTIGQTTGGKNSMMFGFQPSDFTNSYTGEAYFSSSIDNWLMYPIVAVYMNATGETFDTSDGTGIEPDYTLSEYADLVTSGLKELGDPEETLTAAALEYLNTGTISSSNKALTIEPEIQTSSVAQKRHLFVKPFKQNN